MVRDFLATICRFPAPYIHYAHVAQYDWRYILPYLAEHEIPCEVQMRTESDIYEVRIHTDDGDVIMRDSYAIFDHKLEELAKAFCPEIPKLSLDLDKITFDPHNPEHEAYARRDAMILAEALPRMAAQYQRHFNITIGPTLAGTGIKAWQETLADDEYYESMKNDKLEAFVREAYYGGLVFLTRTDLLRSHGDNPVAVTIDINSSYPAAMCDFGVPYGRVFSSRDYHENRMGIYRVRVRAPEDLIIPILPRRTDKGAMAWSRGEFETTVTNRELIFAANQGYEILDIYEGVVWEETIFPFNEVIDLCKQLRRKYKGLPEEMIAKKMQNSIYGRFGSRRERVKIYVPKNNEEMMQGAPLDACDYFYWKTETADTMKCLPHWAAFITAHARLRLLQTAYSIGPENVIYGDTDSLTILDGHLDKVDIGEEYGQFKLEKSWREFRAIAPKVYAGQLIEPDEKGRLYKGAAKGVPRKRLDDKNWRELIDTGKTRASALSLSSLRVSLAKGMREARELDRKSSDIANSKNWELHGDWVRPKIA